MTNNTVDRSLVKNFIFIKMLMHLSTIIYYNPSNHSYQVSGLSFLNKK